MRGKLSQTVVQMAADKRLQLGLTYTQASKIMGIDRGTLAQIEAQKRPASTEQLGKILKFVDRQGG